MSKAFSAASSATILAVALFGCAGPPAKPCAEALAQYTKEFTPGGAASIGEALELRAPMVQTRADGGFLLSGGDGRSVSVRLRDTKEWKGVGTCSVRASGSADSLPGEQLIASLRSGVVAKEAAVNASRHFVNIKLTDVQFPDAGTHADELDVMLQFEGAAAAAGQLAFISAYALTGYGMTRFGGD